MATTTLCCLAIVGGALGFSATPRAGGPAAASRLSACGVRLQEGGPPKSFDQFKRMIQDQGVETDKLTVGEQVQRGMAKSWVNPAYWNRQFVTAQHIGNNVPKDSRVIELGKDAKNLYYLDEPRSATLIVPPSNYEVKEGPIREAAAKLNLTSFALYTDRPLDNLPINPNSFDAALCFDMLDTAPREAAIGALNVLVGALVPGGRLLFLERDSVGLPALAREYGLSVKFETEGGFDVGIATNNRRGAPGKAKRGAAAAKGGKRAVRESDRAAMAAKGGFGAAARGGKAGKLSAEQKQERKELKKANKFLNEEAERDAAATEAAAAAQAEREAAERAAAERAAEERAAAEAAAAAAAQAEREAAERAAAERAEAEAAAAEAAAEAAAQAEREAVERAAAERAAKAKAAADAAQAAQAAAEAAKAEAAKAKATRLAAEKAAAEEAAAEAKAKAEAEARAKAKAEAEARARAEAEARAKAEAEAKAKAKAEAEARAKAEAKARAAAEAEAEAKAAERAEEKLRRLLRREVVEGLELSAEDDAWLDRVEAEQEELYERVDREVEAEAEALEAGGGGAPDDAAGVGEGEGAAGEEYRQVVCPAELGADRALRVALEDGREFDVVVPDGVAAGDEFTVGPFPAAGE